MKSHSSDSTLPPVLIFMQGSKLSFHQEIDRSGPVTEQISFRDVIVLIHGTYFLDYSPGV